MRLEILPFTDSLQAALEFINKLAAFGGGDTPEDLAGAIGEANKLNWKAKARYCVIVTDAPCHGK